MPIDVSNCPPRSYETCQLAGGKPCLPCSRAKSLDIMITEAKRALEDLLSQRRDLDREVNERHDPITNRLPPEVFASIFLHSLADYRNLDLEYNQGKLTTTPLVLSAVCQTWRNIVQASPDLWTDISIWMTETSFDTIATTLDMAHQWISRAGQLPLVLRIHSPMHSHIPITRVSDTRFHVTAFIQRYLLRWRRLEFECTIGLIPCFIGLAPVLEVLKIVSDDLEHQLNTSIHLHSIKAGARISVVGYGLRRLNIPWENVGIYEGDITAQGNLEVVERSSRLSEYILVRPKYNHRAISPPGTRTLTHNTITSLSIDATSWLFTDPLLETLNLPCLTHLKICNIRPACLLRFIQRSSCNLTSLSITIWVDAELIDALRAISSLHELHLDVVAGSDRCVSVFLDTLSTTAVNGVNPQNNFLPNLSTLRIRFSAETGFFWELVTGVFGTFEDIQNPKRRPITTLGVSYDWQIGDTQPVLSSPFSPDVPSYHLNKRVTRRFLTIAKAGVRVDLFDTFTQTDMFRTALEYHDIEIPEGYKTNVDLHSNPQSQFGHRYHQQPSTLQMTRISECEFNSDYDLSEESDRDSEDDSEDDYTSESSDASDRSYDYWYGLPASVTGETSDLMCDDVESVLETEA